MLSVGEAHVKNSLYGEREIGGRDEGYVWRDILFEVFGFTYSDGVTFCFSRETSYFGKMWSVLGSNPVGAAGLVGAISFRIDRRFSFRCFRNVDMQE